MNLPYIWINILKANTRELADVTYQNSQLPITNEIFALPPLFQQNRKQQQPNNNNFPK